MAIYNVGLNNTIEIDVFVTTEGGAASTVFQKRGSASKVQIAESKTKSGGIIPRSELGTSMSLINSLILIITSIDFSGLDEENLDSAINNASVTYTLSGGVSGTTIFPISENDVIIAENKRVMTFLKFVDMIF